MPRYGWFFLGLLAGIAMLIQRSKVISSAQPGAWLPMLLIIFFLVHGCVDFPFYDHSLMAIFLVLVFSCCTPVPAQGVRHGVLKWAIFLALLWPCWLAARRQQTLTDFTQQLRQVEMPQLEATCRNMPDEWPLWESAYERVAGTAGHDALLRLCLEHLLRHQPRSANLCLQQALMLGDDPAARTWYEQATTYAPRQARHAFYFAHYLRRLGRNDEARIWMDKALHLHQHAATMSREHIDFQLLMLGRPELQHVF